VITMQCMMICDKNCLGDVVCSVRAPRDQCEGIGNNVRIEFVEPSNDIVALLSFRRSIEAVIPGIRFVS
jgi:hypothetical protein